MTGLRGSVPRKISQHGSAVFPAWSPDGRQLAIGAYEPKPDPEYHLYVVSAHGGKLRELSTDVAVEAPTWSPDGEWITAVGAVGTDASIKLVRPNGEEQETLVDFAVAVVYRPVWSPDGSQLSFIAAAREQEF